MSRFQNSYLAESVGYANGVASGVSAGKQAGFTEGWNAAIMECNPMIEERDREIARLSGEITRCAAHTGQPLT